MAKKTTETTVPSTSSTLPSTEDTGLGGGQQQPDQTQPQDWAVYSQTKYNEAWGRLRGIATLQDRIKFLNMLRSRGFQSGSEVSIDGLGEADRQRMRDFLIYADVSNLTFGQAQTQVGKFPLQSLTGSTRRATPVQDVDSVFKQVVVNQLGRAPKPDEIERFRNAYGTMERGMNPPSISSAAQEQAVKMAPDEAQATRFADYAKAFEQMMRGA